MAKIPKILQITIISITVFVAVFIVLSLIFGEKEENIVKFLDSADAIKKFKAQMGNNQKSKDSKISPLVKEAKEFALYLDPPPPPVTHNPSTNKAQIKQKTVVTAPRVPIVTYELLATIVNPNKPEESRAMIDLPGAGQKLIQQGQQVGHTTVEEIKNGSIMIKAGETTEELMAKISPIPSLIMGAPNHVFKLFPDLKTEAHLTDLENLPSTTPNTTPATSSRFSGSGRSAVETPTSSASIRPITSRTSRKIGTPVALTSSTRSSRSLPPALTPEQEKKAMNELMSELSKEGIDTAQMESLMKAMNAENTMEAQETPVQTAIEKSEPNKTPE